MTRETKRNMIALTEVETKYYIVNIPIISMKLKILMCMHSN